MFRFRVYRTWKMLGYNPEVYGKYCVIHFWKWYIRIGECKKPLFLERYPSKKWYYFFNKRLTITKFTEK